MVERDGMLIMVDDDRLELLPNEQIEMKSVRFRTLGCYPLTGAVESTAATLPEIIQEEVLNPLGMSQSGFSPHQQVAFSASQSLSCEGYPQPIAGVGRQNLVRALKKSQKESSEIVGQSMVSAHFQCSYPKDISRFSPSYHRSRKLPRFEFSVLTPGVRLVPRVAHRRTAAAARLLSKEVAMNTTTGIHAGIGPFISPNG